MNKLCRGWNYTSNHSMDEDGRIILIWKDTVALRVLQQSKQAVTCEIKLPGSQPFVYTAVYASNEAEERTDLWVELLNTANAFALDQVPWIMGGDFNQIMHFSEHSNPDVNCLSSRMVEFKDCLTQTGLYDLRYQGPVFTWTNKQPDSPVAKKLDRLLINSQVLNLFPNCSSFFLPALTSDHSPCILDLAYKTPTHGTRPFKFYNYLTKHPNFLQVVDDAWAQAGSIAWNLSALCWKQKQIKRELKALNRENFSQIQMRVSEANQEGGLGIKNLTVWNKACCLKLIWLLFFQSGSIWVAWFVEEVLQGTLSNLWTTLPNRRFSWQVNKLLKLSPLLYQWIKLRVGNGLSCRFWTDNWSEVGSMRQHLQLGSTSLGIPAQATLASLYTNGAWQIPPARSESQVEVHAILTTIHLNEEEDTYVWEIEGKHSSRYSIGQVYSHLMQHGPSVPWHQTVWNKGGIPRQSFLSWLLVLDRCPTRDRLISWGLATSTLCLLCNVQPESRNHLFFECPFTWEIWSHLFRRCTQTPERDWSRVLDQLQHLNRRSPIGILSLLCWQSCLYWSWSERNSRLHRHTFRPPSSLIRQIDRQIKDRILSLRSRNPTVSSIMMQRWLA
ncbi:hypothetical protein YC2023_093145 [Brassica napus]